MRWRRRGLDRVRQARVDQLRHLAEGDPTYLRLLAVQLLEGATDLTQARRSADAIPVLDELVAVLRVDPAAASRSPDRMMLSALSLLGTALESQGSDRAEPVVREALDLVAAGGGSTAAHIPEPELVTSCLLNLMNSRVRAGDYGAALDHLRHAEYVLRTHEQSDTVWALRGVVRIRRRQVDVLGARDRRIGAVWAASGLR